MSLFDNADRVPAVIQVRRGKDAERQIKRYDVGELIYTTDTKRLYIGDGNSTGTYGGVIASNKTWIGPNFANFPAQLGDLIYRTDAAPVGTGFYMLTGYNFPKNDIRNYVLVGGEALLAKAIPYNLPKASAAILGGVKINNSPIAIDGNGFLTLRIDSTLAIENGVLKVIATTGGTKIINNSTNIVAGNALTYNSGTGVLDVNVLAGNPLKVNSSNQLYVDTVGLNTLLSINKASTTQYGVVKIKDTNSGIDVLNGIISTKIATRSNLGAVAIGNGLTVDSDTGVVSTSADFIPKPSSPANGQILSYSTASNAWVASNASVGGSSGGGIKIFDTVGANQSWTCPAGVYSVKITVIGGGGGGGADAGTFGVAGGSSSCSIGGVTITATGGGGGKGVNNTDCGGTGGSVAGVAGYVGQGTGGIGGSSGVRYGSGANGSGSNGGYGGGGGSDSFEAGGGGCGIGGGGAGTNIMGGVGTGYGGHGGHPNRGCVGYGGGGGGQGTAPSGDTSHTAGGGGGGGYAVYTISVIGETTYTNSITVGAGGVGAEGALNGAHGAVIIEW